MRADSYDITYENYFKPGAMFEVGVFDKEIYDYIQSDVGVLPVTNNGVTENVVMTMPQNHGHGRVRGLEAQLSYFFDFLPGPLSGIGTELNFVTLATKGTENTSGSVFDPVQTGAAKLNLPLEQLSNHSYNAILMYNKYGIDARLAYSWRERYLLSASASNVQAPAYMEDFGQLDGSLLYSINNHLKVGVQAVNILNAKNIIDIDERNNWYYGTEGNMSNSLIYRHNWTVSDQRFSIVLRGVF
jgi:TonB-dependent receptor